VLLRDVDEGRRRGRWMRDVDVCCCGMLLGARRCLAGHLGAVTPPSRPCHGSFLAQHACRDAGLGQDLTHISRVRTRALKVGAEGTTPAHQRHVEKPEVAALLPGKMHVPWKNGE